MLVVDLRLLGFVFQKHRVNELARIMQPWLLWSLIGMLVTGFVLFMGAAMSVTAFPVLARILSEQNLLGTRLGVLTITCAAVDDVTAALHVFHRV